MDSIIIFAIPFALFTFVTSIIMPWINRGNIAELRGRVDRLQKEILRLKRAETTPSTEAQPESKVDEFIESDIPARFRSEPETPPTPHHVADDFDEEYSSYIPTREKIAAYKKATEDTRENAPERIAPEVDKAIASESQHTFEQQFGGKAFVWLGGIALALAGFFLVKYSIEAGLLTERVRVLLGLLFGGALLYGSHIVRERPDMADGTRISQALAGAGIADLYGCFFAATSLYHLIPSLAGFTCMAGVTALALVMSLRFGAPIALLGLIGGFATPTLFHSDPNTPLLFGYLYLVFGGLAVVIRSQKWWWMSIPATLVAFLWVVVWLFIGTGANDGIWLSLFLLGISGTVVASTHAVSKELNDMEYLSWCRYLTLGGAALLMGFVTYTTHYGALEWDMYGLFCLAAVVMAWFDYRTYGFAPWVTMGANIAMILAWDAPSNVTLAVTVGVFGLLFTASGIILQSRSERSLVWASLTAVASLAYYVLGYFELRHTGLFENIPLFWGLLALGLSGASLIMLQTLMRDVPNNHPQRQYLLAVYAALTTAFLSIGLTIELKREFLSVAFAGEMMAIAWINTRFNIKALRSLVGILALVFGFLLVPQILLLVQLTAYSLVEAHLALQDTLPIVNWPLFQLGLPAVFFAGSSALLRSERDDSLVQALEISAIALIGVMGYYLTRHAFHVNENILFIKAGFIERNIITNIVFAYGLACMWMGRAYVRQAVVLSGCVLVAIALFRLGYFEYIAYNPLWSSQAVGSWPLFNGLLLAYGMPMLWAALAGRELMQLKQPVWSRYASGSILVLLFTFVSLNVRQFYHGTYLNDHVTSNAEVYAYSAAWLLMGIGLLVAGVIRKDRMIRLASLLIMLLTVGKAFLYDASLVSQH